MDYRRVLYVGGLDQSVTEHILQASFIPFGPIKAVEIPRENISVEEQRSLPHNNFLLPFEQQESGKGRDKKKQRTLLTSRGFGYVEFEFPEDAAEAKDNMDGAELQGRVLRVDIAKKENIKLGSKKPAWHDLNDWYREKLNAEGFMNDEDARDFDRKAQQAKRGEI